MNDAIDTQDVPADQPLLDTTLYGFGKDDSISDGTENAAITPKTALFASDSGAPIIAALWLLRSQVAKIEIRIAPATTPNPTRPARDVPADCERSRRPAMTITPTIASTATIIAMTTLRFAKNFEIICP